MQRAIILISILLISNGAQAIGHVSGTVKSVRVDRNGWGMIQFSVPIGHEPASCRSSSYTSHLSFDTNTEGGKAIYSMGLAAAASGKKITACGTGSCSEYPGIVESMSYGHFYKD